MKRTMPRREPLYSQIRRILCARISDGEWQVHEALPSEWDLAAELGVSQGSVRKALQELTQEGVVYRVQGKGTFVADPPGDWGRGRLQTPGQFGADEGVLTRELLECSRQNAPDDVAALLQLRRAAPVWRVRFLWRLSGEVLALDDALLPAERFDELDARWLRQSQGGVYEVLLRRFGVRVGLREEQFTVEALEREEALILGVDAGLAVLCVQRLSHDRDGAPLEWRRRLYLTRSHAWAMSES